MIIKAIEWYKALDRDCCFVDLTENNLPSESKTELRKVLVLGMDIEIDGVDYKLRGIDAYATDHIPGGKVGLWVEQLPDDDIIYSRHEHQEQYFTK